MPIVDVPGIGRVSFLDDMTEDDISNAIDDHFKQVGVEQSIRAATLPSDILNAPGVAEASAGARAEHRRQRIADVRALQEQRLPAAWTLQPETIAGLEQGVRPFLNPPKAAVQAGINLVAAGQRALGLPSYDPEATIVPKDVARNVVESAANLIPGESYGQFGQGAKGAAADLIAGLKPADITMLSPGGSMGFATEMAAGAPDATAAAAEALGRGDTEEAAKQTINAGFGVLGPRGIFQHLAGRLPVQPETPAYRGTQIPTPRGAYMPPEAAEIARNTPEAARALENQMQREATGVDFNPARRYPKPVVPEEGAEPTLPEMTPAREELTARELQMDQVIQANARTKEEIRKLFPEMNRQQAAELRNEVWGDETDPNNPTRLARLKERLKNARGQVEQPQVPVEGVNAALAADREAQNAQTIRSDTGRPGETGAPPEGGEADSGGNVEQTPPGGPKPVEPGGAAQTPSQTEVAPETPAPTVPPVDHGPAEAFAKESGFTLKTGQIAGGVAEPDWSKLSPEDAAIYKQLIAQTPKVWEFTDRRPDSPTKGLTFYVPEGSTPEAIRAKFSEKMAQEKVAAEPPPAPPEPPKPAEPGRVVIGTDEEGKPLTISAENKAKLDALRSQTAPPKPTATETKLPVEFPTRGTAKFDALPIGAKAAIGEYEINQKIIDTGLHPDGKKATKAQIAELVERQKQVIENFKRQSAQILPKAGEDLIDLGNQPPPEMRPEVQRERIVRVLEQLEEETPQGKLRPRDLSEEDLEHISRQAAIALGRDWGDMLQLDHNQLIAELRKNLGQIENSKLGKGLPPQITPAPAPAANPTLARLRVLLRDGLKKGVGPEEWLNEFEDIVAGNREHIPDSLQDAYTKLDKAWSKGADENELRSLGDDFAAELAKATGVEPPARRAPLPTEEESSVQLPEQMSNQDFPPPATDQEPDLVLLGCGKEKVSSTTPVPAADLYTGQLFKGRRGFAESQSRPWMILSAAHGVIEPGKKISPYDTTIGDLSAEELATWKSAVRAKVIDYFGGSRENTIGKTIELHAGSEYLKAFNSALEGLGISVVPAMEGKGIGTQLAIYKQGYKRPHTIAPLSSKTAAPARIQPPPPPEPEVQVPEEQPAAVPPKESPPVNLAMQDKRVPQELKDAHAKAVADLRLAEARMPKIEEALNAIEAQRKGAGNTPASLAKLAAKEDELLATLKQLRKDTGYGGPLSRAVEEALWAMNEARYQADVAPFRSRPEPPGTQKITSADLKAQRDNLLGQISEALKKAPEENGSAKITMAVPGDGEFSIFNNKEALKKFQKIVTEGSKDAGKFPVTATKPGGPESRGGAIGGRVMPKAEPPKAEKGKTLGETIAKIISRFVSDDPDRFAITTSYADGTQIIATDGRRMVRVVTKEAPGTPSKPVRLDTNGKPIEVEADYPNYNQVWSETPDLVRGGADTGELWTAANQAKALWSNATDRENPTMRLYLNKDGTIGATAKRVDVGEYEHNLKPGAVVIGDFNPDYLFDSADVARRLGADKVDLYSHGGAHNPLEIRGKNFGILTMPQRMDEGEGAKNTFPPSQAVHGTLPRGLEPLRNPEGPITQYGEMSKFRIIGEGGQYKIEFQDADKKGYHEAGTISEKEIGNRAKLAATVQKEFSGKTPETWVTAAKKVIDGIRKERADLVKRAEERKTEGVSKALQDFLDRQATEALQRISKRTPRLGSGPDPVTELANFKDYAIFAAAKLAKYGVNRAAWAADVIKSLGPKVKPFIDKLYDAAKAHLEQYHIAIGKAGKATDVQKIINEATGVEKRPLDSISATIDAMQTSLRTVRALKEHFTGQPKASQAEVKVADNWLEADANRIREGLTELVKKELPPEERGRFITAINNAAKRSPILTGDPEAMYRRAAEVAARIQDRAQEVRKINTIQDLKTTVSRALSSPNVDIGYKNRILDLLKRINFTRPTAETLDSLKATRDYIDRMAAEGKDVEIPREILDHLEVLTKVPIRDMPIDAIRALADKIGRLEQLGRLKVKARAEAWEIEKRARMADLAEEPTTPLEKRPQFIHQPGDTMPPSIKLRNYLNRMLNAASFVDKAYLPQDAVFDMLGDSKANYRGWLFRQIRGPLDLAFNEYSVLRDKITDPITALVKKYKMGQREAERINTYARAMQEGGKERLIAQGVDPKTIDKIIETFTPEERHVYGAMRKAMDTLLPEMQKLMHELYNTEVKPVENYWPLPRDWESMREMLKPEDMKQPPFGEPMTFDDLAGWKDMYRDFVSPKTTKTEQGATIERKPKAMTPVQNNAFDVFYQHINDVAYLLKTQRDLKMAGEMARTDQFAGKYGKVGQALVLDFLDTYARQGRLGGLRRIPWLDELRTRTAVGIIGFRVASNMVHASNVAFAVERAGIQNYSAAMAEIASGRADEFMHKNFAEAFSRGGGEPGLVEAAAKGQSVFGKTVVPKELARASMAGARAIDRINAEATMLGVYFKELRRKGIDPATYLDRPIDKEAQAYAMVLARRAVASPLPKDVPSAISRGTLTGGNISIGKSVMQFQNIFADQWSNLRYDLWRAGIRQKDPIKAARMTLAIMGVIALETGIREGVKAGLGAVTDKKSKEEDLQGAVTRELVRRFPLGGQTTAAILYDSSGVPMIDAFWDPAKEAYRAIKAKNPTKQDQHTIRALTGAGQLMGLPVGQLGEIAADSMAQ